jgi:hypothetical protein
MSRSRTFTWNDRLTLIRDLKPTDEQACAAFGISQPELDVARSQLRAGVFSYNDELDTSSYSNLFASAEVSDGTSSTVTSTTSPPRTNTTVTSTKAAPETASKVTREPKKRGRKGDKITQAFSSIPSTPVAAEEFAKQHGVSIAVLRQSKRFDSVGGGTVKVKKDKATKTLMIWREQV